MSTRTYQYVVEPTDGNPLGKYCDLQPVDTETVPALLLSGDMVENSAELDEIGWKISDRTDPETWDIGDVMAEIEIDNRGIQSVEYDE